MLFNYWYSPCMQLATIRLREHFQAQGFFRLSSDFQSCLSGSPAAGVGSVGAASFQECRSRLWWSKGHNKGYFWQGSYRGKKICKSTFLLSQSTGRVVLHNLRGLLLTFLFVFFYFWWFRTHLPFSFPLLENWMVCFNKQKVQLHMVRDVADLFCMEGQNIIVLFFYYYYFF